jgi:response regulator RpfG family c-di-GMP phosphodiesterase
MAAGYRIAKCTAEIASAAEPILSHHEWWDGMGYPNQLRGEEIPIESRITSIFDAMESLATLGANGRRYSSREAWAAVTGGAGRQFDPSLISVFTSMLEEKPPKFLKDWGAGK